MEGESFLSSMLEQPRSRTDWTPFYLEFEALQTRLASVKREFGLRKAVSTKSLKGETRTLAEILDKEVEKIVLFYLRIQGDLAERTWELREKQVHMLKGDTVVTDEQIEIMCQHFRDLSYEVIELLEFLDYNVLGLRRIIKRHDKMFDLKMGRIYFDSRLQGGGKNSPLIQLYHQEGIRAIVATIRKGLEDLHEAKIDLNSIKNWQLNKGGSGKHESPSPNYGAITADGYGLPLHAREGSGSSTTSASSAYSGYGYIQAGLSRISSSGSLLSPDQIPRTRYLTRLKESNSVPQLDDIEALEASVKQARIDQGQQKLKNNSGSYYEVAGVGLRRVSSWLSGQPMQGTSVPRGAGGGQGLLLTRTISDLEPCLRRLTDTQEKVVRSQQRTTSEYLATHSIMALENQDEGEEEEGEDGGGVGTSMGLEALHGKVTSKFGLFLHLLVTFLYMANQYVVAPTSAEYSRILGEDAAMSGLIIGLSPAAALISALVYSIWTNYSFRDPLIVAVSLAVIGNLMYALAYQVHSPLMLFCGRIVSGLGAPRGIARRYISDHVAPKHRTLASSHFVTASALGLAFGPLISSVFTFANINITYSIFDFTLVRLVNVTAPGWIMFVLWLTVLISIFTSYEEPLVMPPKLHESAPMTGTGASPVGPIPVPLLTALWRLVGSVLGSVLGSCACASACACGRGSSSPSQAWQDLRHSWNHMLDKPSVSALLGLSRTGADTRGGVYQALSGLHENVVSVELGDLLEREEPKDSIVGGARGRTRTTSSDILEGAPTVEGRTSPSSSPSVGGEAGSKDLGEKARQKDKDSPSSRSVGMRYDDGTSEEDSPVRTSSLQPLAASDNRYEPPARGSGGSPSSYQRASPRPGLSPTGPLNLPPTAPDNAKGKREGGSLWSYLDYDTTIVLLVYFVNKTGQEMVVSCVPLLTGALFNWDYNSAGFFMAAMGAMVLPATIFISGLKEVEERALALVLFYCCLGAVLVIVNILPFEYTPFQYTAGSVLLFSFLCAQEGVIMSLLSKIIPPEMARGTLNSGFLTTEVGTLGRVLSDITITWVASANLPPVDTVNHLFMPVGAAVLITTIFFRINYDNLGI